MGVSTKSLKEFVTSERDILRLMTRMPPKEFRLWEENIVQEEGEELEKSSIENENDAEFYDGFVIVEKLNIEKYND